MRDLNQLHSGERPTVGEAIIVPAEIRTALQQQAPGYMTNHYGLLLPLSEYPFADKAARTMNWLGRDFKNYSDFSAVQVKIGMGTLGVFGMDRELIPQAGFIAVLVAGILPQAVPLVGAILTSNANQVLDREAYPGPRLTVLPYGGDARIVTAPGATMFLTNDI